MWDTVWPLLLAALATLLVTSFVQLWVVPRVETRKRREDRWERDVRALGELLAFGAHKVVSAVVVAVRVETLVSAKNSGMDPKTLKRVRREQDERVADTMGDYDQLTSQVQWLTARVLAVGDSPEQEGLRVAHRKYAIARALALRLRDRDRQLLPKDADALVDALENARSAMTTAVEDLADGRPPSPGRRRLRRTLVAQRLQRRALDRFRVRFEHQGI